MSPGLTDLVVDRMGWLSDEVREVVDLLAVGEPLGVALLGRLSDPVAVEDGEARGLVRVDPDGDRWQARLAHPLYGEVRRAQLGRLRARRLRGQIAVALTDAAEAHATDSLRRAVLALDSDLPPDPRLLTSAARSACQLVDFNLAERLASAAVAAGGGLEPGVTLAYVLGFQSRATDAETVLAGLDSSASTDLHRTVIANMRAANLLWAGRRPLEARAVLDRAAATVTDEDCRRSLGGMRAALRLVEGHPNEAVELALDTLSGPDVLAPAVMAATYALVAGLGVLGRADELASAAARGYDEAARSSDLAFLRFGLASLHIDGLRLAGYVQEAEAIARDRRRESSDMPGPAQLYGNELAGQVALARGRLQTAARWLREVHAGLAPNDLQAFDFVCLLNLTEALALVGDAGPARQLCDRLEAERHPAFSYLEPEVLLAEAWVVAAEGRVHQAVLVSHQAAAEAGRLGQLAHEVVALQTAVRLGDRTLSERLTALAATVDGPACAGRCSARRGARGQRRRGARRRVAPAGGDGRRAGGGRRLGPGRFRVRGPRSGGKRDDGRGVGLSPRRSV